MRSFLFVPGDSLRKFESAKKTSADALILDLEDSIAPDEKIGARKTVCEMLDARNPGQKAYIRVNALDTGLTASCCRNAPALPTSTVFLSISMLSRRPPGSSTGRRESSRWRPRRRERFSSCSISRT
jgi:hypothetical protein